MLAATVASIFQGLCQRTKGAHLFFTEVSDRLYSKAGFDLSFEGGHVQVR